MKIPIHSIRWRIQLWYGAFLFLAIGAFSLTAFKLVSIQQLRAVNRDLRKVERQFITNLLKDEFIRNEIPRQEESPPPEVLMEYISNNQKNLPVGFLSRLQQTLPKPYYFAFALENGLILLNSENLPESVKNIPEIKNSSHEKMRSHGYFRESLHQSPNGVSFLIGRSIETELHDLNRLGLSLGFSALALWALGLFGGWWIAGRAISPISDISDTATRIAQGNLKERIQDTGNKSELGQLSLVLNNTFERLHQALTRQQEFTASASHELRTPLTILLSETQRMRKRERSVEEYKESLELCHDASLRMKKLVEDLLLLARQDSIEKQSARTPQEIQPLIESSMEQFQPLAKEKEIQIHAKLESAMASVDSEMISLVIDNLIGNAITHHDGKGHIYINCKSGDNEVIIEVKDDGPGIDETDLPHIFERFYRAENSRSQSEHSGLGLSMVQAIIQTHNGHIDVKSEPGQGSCFRVSIPHL